MKTLIQWLLEIEQLSAKIYTQAAKGIRDPQIQAFLNHLAEDEFQHYATMQNAAQTIEDRPDLLSDIALDRQTQKKIERTLKGCQKKLEATPLTLERIVDCIIEMEFSEWNPFFLYVVNVLKKTSPEFKAAAAEMQSHLRHIEHFLISQAYGRQKIKFIKQLKPVWKENILIVDDEPEILELLSNILKKEGYVSTAENGKIGLEMIRNTYYRLIISDVEMPVLNGLDLYSQASSEFKDIHERFVFFTGSPENENINFFRKHNLKYLIKPVNIHLIQDMVLKTMHHIPKSN